MSLADELLVTIVGSLTLAVFTTIFAAMGYGVYEIRKVRSLVQDLREAHQRLEQDYLGTMARLDLILEEDIVNPVQQPEQANLENLGVAEHGDDGDDSGDDGPP